MNKIKLSGVVATPITLSHEVFGEKFYNFTVISERVSGFKDVIPCIVPETYVEQVTEGEKITVIGTIRTRNVKVSEDKACCEIKVFVNEITEYDIEDCNEVFIDGFICKEPMYRETPLGRKITDMLVASNRERSNKSDYIPCVTWGRNAIRSSEMQVSNNVVLNGRLQSREYTKRYEDEKEEIKTVYEVSVAKIQVKED